MEPLRVTTILGYFEPPELVDWRCRVGKAAANKIMRDTSKWGTRIDEIIKGGLVPVSKDKAEVKSCYRAFEKWRKVYDPKEIVACTRFYGKIAGVEITGEPDLLIDAVLHDLKGTNALRKKNWVQVNVYEELRRQNGLRPSEGLRLLRLDRNLEVYEYPDARPFDKAMVEIFEGLLMAYLYYKENDDDGDDT